MEGGNQGGSRGKKGKEESDIITFLINFIKKIEKRINNSLCMHEIVNKQI